MFSTIIFFVIFCWELCVKAPPEKNRSTRTADRWRQLSRSSARSELIWTWPRPPS